MTFLSLLVWYGVSVVICFVFLNTLWVSLLDYQKYQSRDTITKYYNLMLREEDHIVATLPYYKLYNILCVNVKFLFLIFKEYTVVWTRTYNLFNKLVAWLCFIITSPFVLICLTVFGLCKALGYYVAVAFVIFIHRFISK